MRVTSICPLFGPGSILRIDSETGGVLILADDLAVKPLERKIVMSSLQFACCTLASALAGMEGGEYARLHFRRVSRLASFRQSPARSSKVACSRERVLNSYNEFTAILWS